MAGFVTCQQCFLEFYQDKPWKRICLNCWRKNKGRIPPRAATKQTGPDYKVLWERADAENFRLTLRIADLERQLANRPRSPLESELKTVLPRLVQCCHPDKHGNSPAATVATQWLLEIRRRLNA